MTVIFSIGLVFSFSLKRKKDEEDFIKLLVFLDCIYIL